MHFVVKNPLALGGGNRSVQTHQFFGVHGAKRGRIRLKKMRIDRIEFGTHHYGAKNRRLAPYHVELFHRVVSFAAVFDFNFALGIFSGHPGLNFPAYFLHAVGQMLFVVFGKHKVQIFRIAWRVPYEMQGGSSLKRHVLA